MYRPTTFLALLFLTISSATAAEPSLDQLLEAQGQHALTEIRSDLREWVRQDLADGASRLLFDLRREIAVDLPEQMREVSAPTLANASSAAPSGVMALEDRTPGAAVTLH